MTGLLDDALAFFEAFGYVALPVETRRAELQELGQECEAALTAAFGTRERRHDLAASSRCYLPMMGDATPRSVALVHDGLFVETACRLLGEAPIVKPAKVSLFVGESSWHRDCHSGVRGVKFVSYFGSEPVRFDVVPGSHGAAAGRVVDSLLGADRLLPWETGSFDRLRAASIPVHQVALEPRQLQACDLLWSWTRSPSRPHASGALADQYASGTRVFAASKRQYEPMLALPNVVAGPAEMPAFADALVDEARRMAAVRRERGEAPRHDPEPVSWARFVEGFVPFLEGVAARCRLPT